MKKPNKKDYITTNQFTYDEKLNEYYEQLQKYVEYLENKKASSQSEVKECKVVDIDKMRYQYIVLTGSVDGFDGWLIKQGYQLIKTKE